MEFVRKVIPSGLIEHAVALPESMKNKQVEILILPIDEPDSEDKQPASLMGALKEYADISKINQEKDAWEHAAREKHAHS